MRTQYKIQLAKKEKIGYQLTLLCQIAIDNGGKPDIEFTLSIMKEFGRLCYRNNMSKELYIEKLTENKIFKEKQCWYTYLDILLNRQKVAK